MPAVRRRTAASSRGVGVAWTVLLGVGNGLADVVRLAVLRGVADAAGDSLPVVLTQPVKASAAPPAVSPTRKRRRVSGRGSMRTG
jgi:hypothetical protein